MFIAVIFYFIAFGLSLFNHGVYWDDWAQIVGKSPEFIINTAGHQAGYIISAYIFNLINLFQSYNLYHIITFFAYLASGFCFWGILKSIKEIQTKIKLLLVIFFLLFPANDARVVLVILHNSLNYLFFYFGWWLTSKYLQNRKIIFRITALIFLFLSFAVNSLLIFYFCVLAYIAYKEKLRLHSWESVRAFIVKFYDFLLLPLIFFFVKNIFFTPYGEYDGYNAIKIFSVCTAFYRSFSAFISSFLLVFLSSFYSLLNMSLINTVWQAVTELDLHPYIQPLRISDTVNLICRIASLSWYEIIKKNLIVTISTVGLSIFFVYLSLRNYFIQSDKRESRNTDYIFFIIGCICFYLAVYPYYVVNKMPTILEGFLIDISSWFR